MTISHLFCVNCALPRFYVNIEAIATHEKSLKDVIVLNRVLDCRLFLAFATLAVVAVPQRARAANVSEETPVFQLNPRAQLTRTTYRSYAAFRLSDGRTEAIIVPALSRVMAYRFVGGQNVLWNNPDNNAAPGANAKPGVWHNLGGDKNWFAPQTWWPATSGTNWPPDKAWDNAPFGAEVLAGARLRTTSPVAQRAGVRIIREYAINASGELEIQQTAEKLSGAPLMLSIWNISQTQPDAVYLPLNPQSVYKNNFLWFNVQPKTGADIQAVTPTLLRFRPIAMTKDTPPGGYKIGVDSRVVAFVAVKGDVAFVAKSHFDLGAYPDGPENAGFPVELYDSAEPNAAKHYIELEMLTPLRLMTSGSRWQNTLRWNLKKLKSNASNAPQTHAEIAQMIYAK